MTGIPLSGARVLLIIGGGIAAYKSLELIRRLRDLGGGVRVAMTAAAANSLRPLSAATLAGEAVRDDLFSLTEEAMIGHIELSRGPPTLSSWRPPPRTARAAWPADWPTISRPPVVGDRQARARCAGDERPNVAASRDTAKRRTPQGRWRPGGRTRFGADGVRRIRSRANGRTPSDRRGDRAGAGNRPPRRPIRANSAIGPLTGRHVVVTFRPDLRADRPCQIPRKPLLWPSRACNCAIRCWRGRKSYVGERARLFCPIQSVQP